MYRKTRLIVALDVTEREEALRIAREVADFADAIKIGYPLVLAAGLGILGELSKIAPVIADFKVADIPDINQLICEQAFKSGARAVIVQGFPGRDSLEACIRAARKHYGEVYVVVEMSHPGALEFMRPVAEKIAALSVILGANGVVAPATHPERIKKIREIVGSLTIISPGVGVQGGSPAEAIGAGADYVIVGRSIYQAKEPRKIAMRIVEEIARVRVNEIDKRKDDKQEKGWC